MHRACSATRKQITVLGINSSFGKAVSFLLKQSPIANRLVLYDEANTEVGHDLSEIPSTCKVIVFKGEDQLKCAVKNSDIILIGDKEDSTANSDEVIRRVAPHMIKYAEAISCSAPKAIVLVAASPVNSTLSLYSEVQIRNGSFDCDRVMGVTSVDTMRASTAMAHHLKCDPECVYLPVIGGSSPDTRIPLFSQSRPAISASKADLRKMTRIVKMSECELFQLLNRGDALNKAYATVGLIDSVMSALGGQRKISEIVMSRTCLVPDVDYFSLPVILGPHGIAHRFPLPSLTEREIVLVEHAKQHIEIDKKKGIDALCCQGEPESGNISEKSEAYLELVDSAKKGIFIGALLDKLKKQNEVCKPKVEYMLMRKNKDLILPPDTVPSESPLRIKFIQSDPIDHNCCPIKLPCPPTPPKRGLASEPPKSRKICKIKPSPCPYPPVVKFPKTCVQGRCSNYQNCEALKEETMYRDHSCLEPCRQESIQTNYENKNAAFDERVVQATLSIPSFNDKTQCSIEPPTPSPTDIHPIQIPINQQTRQLSMVTSSYAPIKTEQTTIDPSTTLTEPRGSDSFASESSNLRAIKQYPLVQYSKDTPTENSPVKKHDEKLAEGHSTPQGSQPISDPLNTDTFKEKSVHLIVKTRQIANSDSPYNIVQPLSEKCTEETTMVPMMKYKGDSSTVSKDANSPRLGAEKMSNPELVSKHVTSHFRPDTIKAPVNRMSADPISSNSGLQTDSNSNDQSTSTCICLPESSDRMRKKAWMPLSKECPISLITNVNITKKKQNHPSNESSIPKHNRLLQNVKEEMLAVENTFNWNNCVVKANKREETSKFNKGSTTGVPTPSVSTSAVQVYEKEDQLIRTNKPAENAMFRNTINRQLLAKLTELERIKARITNMKSSGHKKGNAKKNKMVGINKIVNRMIPMAKSIEYRESRMSKKRKAHLREKYIETFGEGRMEDSSNAKGKNSIAISTASLLKEKKGTTIWTSKTFLQSATGSAEQDFTKIQIIKLRVKEALKRIIYPIKSEEKNNPTTGEVRQNIGGILQEKNPIKPRIKKRIVTRKQITSTADDVHVQKLYAPKCPNRLLFDEHPDYGKYGRFITFNNVEEVGNSNSNKANKESVSTDEMIELSRTIKCRANAAKIAAELTEPVKKIIPHSNDQNTIGQIQKPLTHRVMQNTEISFDGQQCDQSSESPKPHFLETMSFSNGNSLQNNSQSTVLKNKGTHFEEQKKYFSVRKPINLTESGVNRKLLESVIKEKSKQVMTPGGFKISIANDPKYALTSPNRMPHALSRHH